MTWSNWAGDESCVPAVVHSPTSVDDLAAVIKQAADEDQVVRVAGAGHSFGDLVCTSGTLISLDGLSGILDVDKTRDLVTVAAGTRLYDLNPALAQHGYALPNLGDIDRQSVAGAINTATHGTGRLLGNLATQVEALELVLADGSVRTITAADDETLRAARVSIGALGVVSAYTLRVVPAFRLRAEERRLRLDETLAQLDELVEANEHFEFFVFPHTTHALIKVNNRTDEPCQPASRMREYVDGHLVQNKLLDVLCRAGRARPAQIPRLNRLITRAVSPSTRVDDSYKIFASPRSVRFTESEWAIPREACAEVVYEILRIVRARGFDVNFPLEVRFVSADEESFLSPAYGRATAYIAVHIYRGMDWRPYFQAVQEIASAYAGRPHWGKRHLLSAGQLAARYPAWNRFQAVRAQLDPSGRFSNEHVRRVLGAPHGA
jgi:L-gulono-1,4-lactone dehydrogenase